MRMCTDNLNLVRSFRRHRASPDRAGCVAAAKLFPEQVWRRRAFLAVSPVTVRPAPPGSASQNGHLFTSSRMWKGVVRAGCSWLCLAGAGQQGDKTNRTGRETRLSLRPSTSDFNFDAAVDVFSFLFSLSSSLLSISRFSTARLDFAALIIFYSRSCAESAMASR